MAQTLSTMALAVLRNAQLPFDANNTSSVQALSDAKAYINERARDVWKRRHWREYIILGTFTVPINVKQIALADIVVDSGFTTAAGGYSPTFAEIVSVRESDLAILPQDASAINAVQPNVWASTTSPVRFVPRGKRGIQLLGVYSIATTLSFFGKADFADLTDSQTWVLDNENALILGGTADLIKFNDRDNNRAAMFYQEYESEIAKLVDAAEVQSGASKKIVPLNPWTDLDVALYANRNISTTGIGED